jgi:glycerophosphoryl diester phosphodiesterase
LIAPTKSPLIIGHRGASAVAPENTLTAFAQAVALGAAGIELDVRLARDDVPVVIHDASLRHTAGRKDRVAQLTSRELGKIDAGTWFNCSHPELARQDYQRETIPTLDQVLTLLQNQTSREAVIYVELKTTRKKAANDRLAATTVEVIKARGFQGRVVVISFNVAVVRLVRELDPSLRTGALFGPRQRATKSVRRIIDETLACGADEILLHHLVAKPALLDRARAANLNPVIWTVDDPKWLPRAQTEGIHALMTNDPAKMLAAAEQRQS